ncbi:hypothetical protein EDC01DRAFT_410529 [Geopyxis carbonaria]|nr:hypothetical protein EDC01DRAFT_410529 [Geopyxis carbonaria]
MFVFSIVSMDGQLTDVLAEHSLGTPAHKLSTCTKRATFAFAPNKEQGGSNDGTNETKSASQLSKSDISIATNLLHISKPRTSTDSFFSTPPSPAAKFLESFECDDDEDEEDDWLSRWKSPQCSAITVPPPPYSPKPTAPPQYKVPRIFNSNSLPNHKPRVSSHFNPTADIPTSLPDSTRFNRAPLHVAAMDSRRNPRDRVIERVITKAHHDIQRLGSKPWHGGTTGFLERRQAAELSKQYASGFIGNNDGKFLE